MLITWDSDQSKDLLTLPHEFGYFLARLARLVLLRQTDLASHGSSRARGRARLRVRWVIDSE